MWCQAKEAYSPPLNIQSAAPRTSNSCPTAITWRTTTHTKYRSTRQTESSTRFFRRVTAPVQVEPQHMETLRERALAAVTDDDRRRGTEQFYRDIPVPETFPAYGGIALSVEGYLWVREYDLPGAEANNWSVYDAGGTLRGTLGLPPRFQPLDIGPDYVLGVWRDADDVEHVQLYDLIKPGQ